MNLKIKKELLQYVVMLENKIDQAYFVKILAEKMNVPQESVYEEIEKINVKDLDLPYTDILGDKGIVNTLGENYDSKRIGTIRRIVGIILWQEKELKIETDAFKKELKRITGSEDIFETFDKDEKENIHYIRLRR